MPIIPVPRGRDWQIALSFKPAWLEPKVQKRGQKECKSRRMGRSALKGDLLNMTRLIALGKSHQLHKIYTRLTQNQGSQHPIPALVGLGFPRVSALSWVWQSKGSGWVRPFLFTNVVAGSLSPSQWITFKFIRIGWYCMSEHKVKLKSHQVS